jgi:ubiquinone biosynthesis protein COQ4
MQAHHRASQALRGELARGLKFGSALEICATFDPEPGSSDRVGLSAAAPVPLPAEDGRAPRFPPDEARPTLGDTYRAFMAWYGLRDGFLPVSSEGARLHVLHDVFHVLGQYETSDADEVALHSFMFGHSALLQARFLRTTWEAATTAPVFKHLTDLRDAFVSAEDFERGARAADLLSIDVARLWDRPVEDLRRRLRIAPRVQRLRSHANTCGGVPFPFWQRQP